MNTQDTQSLKMSFATGRNKGNEFRGDLTKVYKALKVKPMTMKEVDVFTGVMRESICRYIHTLLNEGKITVIRQRKCSVTGYPHVNEYTSDQSLFPKSKQLKLFDHE